MVVCRVAPCNLQHVPPVKHLAGAAGREGGGDMSALDGKVTVVAGGTSGTGARTAELFAEEGARVVIAGRRREEGEALAAQLGPDASFIQTDVLEEAQVKAMIVTAQVDDGGRLPDQHKAKHDR